MSNNPIIELTQKYLLGELSPKEQNLLEKTLASDQDAKDYFDNEIRIEKILREANPKKIKYDLKNDIFEKIDPYKYKKMNSSNFLNFFKRIDLDRVGRYGLSFAVGIFAGLTIYFFTSGNSSQDINTRMLSGTIASINNKIEQPKSETMMKTFNFEDVNMDILLNNFEKSSKLSIEINSTEKIMVILKFNGTEITPSNVKFSEWSENNELLFGSKSLTIQSIGKTLLYIDLRNILTLRDNIDMIAYRNGKKIYNSKVVF